MKKPAFSRIKALGFALKTKRSIIKTCSGVGQEAQETRDMAKLFYRMLENKLELSKRKEPPTDEEVKEAIEQLKDIGRISVFASISIIPGGGFSLIGLEVLARRFGIKNFTFVPSAFRKTEINKETQKNQSPETEDKIQPASGNPDN